ncbi:cytochrome b5 type B-like isoform X1 [Lytechinus pictus]|uniref:cytochrome b5 type B-like isoform X1 n=1 Tax=Lytechinus pictus TaxID=7653 RepID=UPI0030BA1ACB
MHVCICMNECIATYNNWIKKINMVKGEYINKSSPNNNDVDDITQFSMKEVALHSDRGSCWLVIKDFVYDVTSFISEHPGGWEIIMERAGTDATYAFEGKGHSEDAKKLLAGFMIGQLNTNERLEKG